MNLFFSLFSSVLCLCFLNSCSDDAGENPLTETDPPVLLNVFTIDSTITAPYDTVSRIALNYDANGRLVFTSKLEFYSPADTLTLDTMRYFYNNSDTLASRSFYSATYTNSTKQRLLDTTDYLYNAGLLVRDSTYGTRYNSTAQNFITRRISYSSDSIIAFNSFCPRYLGTTQVFSMRHKFMLNVNATTLNQVDTVISYPNALVNLEIWRDYDNMIFQQIPNPLYARSKPVTQPFTDQYLSPYVIIHPRDMPLLVSQRQRGRQTVYPVPGPATNITENWVYQLRPDGYPSVAWRTTQTGTLTPKRFKVLYIYR